MEWRDFCERLADLGEGLEGEGIHHLANQVACWLTYSIGHDDPTHPVLFRSSDPVYQWGGPNADQVARRARIAADGVYRISGRMGSCEEFILQVKRGEAQSGGAGVALEVEASSLGLGPGDDIELVLSPTEPDTSGTWLPLDPEASSVHIRDYYFDWQAAEPATFVIERLDTQGSGAGTQRDTGALLETAAREIEHSMDFWSGYQDRMLGDQPPNTFSPPAAAARGVQGVHYSHAGVALGPDQALVVELDPGGAPLWDIQLYSRPWYEALDFANRLTCLNHALIGPGPIVVAGRDPGGPNWLDTEGRDAVLCTVRWWRAAATPVVVAHVVPLADLDLPPVDRREQIRRRSAHIAWRYRT